MDKQLEERIRERAYEIWLQNGCRPGRSEDDWFEAEREVRAGSSLAGIDLAGMDPARIDPARIDPDGGDLPAAPDLIGAEMAPNGSSPAVKTRRRRAETAMSDPAGTETVAATPRKRRSAKSL